MFNIVSKLTGKSATVTNHDTQCTAIDPQGTVGQKLKQILLGLTQRGEQRSMANDLRRLTIGAAKLSRTPGKLIKMIDGINQMETLQAAEGASHIDANAIANGESGRFDVCDLENWLAIAANAGVPAIEARVIERFTSEEISALSGKISLPDAPRITLAKNRIKDGLIRDHGQIDEITSDQPIINYDALIDRIESAMDDIPEGWMVRTHVCGGNNLKGLAGCGVVGPDVPEVRFGPNLEVGPGWVRRGNRRALDITDGRTISLYVQNDTKPLTVMARPWKTASRYYQGSDPHRAGTPLDVPGLWPAEWRAFVVNGQISAISGYYGWIGDTSPESARQALLVRAAAQKIVDSAIAQQLEPRSMSTVLASLNPAALELLEACQGETGKFSATLDFIETDEGLLFLEGGPASNQIAGGHPCAFAGDHRLIKTTAGKEVRVLNLEGVAFKTMPGVLMAEPATWSPGDKTGCILTWQEVETLSAQ